MPVLHSRRTLALVTTAGAVAVVTGAAMLAAPAAMAAPTGAVAIPGTAPTWLGHAQQAKVAPNVVAAQSVRVYLQPKGGLAALQAEVTALSTPGSPTYQHWLTTAQYEAAYRPTAASVKAVSAYLTSQGLTVTGTEAHSRYVSASGSRAQLAKTFSVTLGNYVHDGQSVVAPSTNVVLPAAVAGNVLTVTGLDTTVTKAKHDAATPDAKPPAAFVNGRPCAVDYGSPLATYQADYTTPLPQFKGETLSYAPCGYTGPSLRSAYEGATTLTGAGVTVAITDAYAWQFLRNDVTTYAANHGDARYAAGQLTQVTPPAYANQAACDPTGWSGEEVLDVEAVHAMAPLANIRYYASPSCFDTDFTDTLAKVVDDNKAQLVSNSWGDAGEEGVAAGAIAADQQVYLQGATQGITFMFSSGDSGDELAGTGIRQPDYPATSPYVTAVGGTSTGIVSGQISFQTSWGTNKWALSANGKRWQSVGFLYGAGGGYSTLFNRPTYQNGVVPASAPAGRAIPDISMDADPNTGMLIGQTQAFPDGVHYGEYRIGGTSLASPLLAGFYALAVQKQGKGYGLLNPTLYAGRAKGAIDVTASTVKGDVRADYANGVDPTGGILYSVRTFGNDSSLPVTAGWDPSTGLGIPSPKLLQTT